jgi:hypothetical protein
LSASRVPTEDAEAYTFYGHVELGVSQDLHHDPRVYVQIHEEVAQVRRASCTVIF